jgi:hypothetical protein
VSIQKRDFLGKVKEREDCNPPDHHLDRQEYITVFRGLEFESDDEIGQKGAFFKGLDT